MSESTPKIIPMCELCRRVYDHPTDALEANAWTHLQTYVTRHRLQARHIAFSPSYCHDCLNGYALAATYGHL
jgi:hypothetical protein